MYAILDNVTNELLESYFDGKDVWTSSKEPKNLVIFSTEKEAEVIVKQVENLFIKAGETEIDFSVIRVREVSHYERE